MAVQGRYDLAVVGAGPGGYVAAIRAAQLGFRVAVVEEDRAGGVCLNWGCIPTKALLTGAELVESLRGRGASFGIDADGVTLDYGRAVDHSRATADRLQRGVESLLARNRIELVRGRARLAGATALDVKCPDAGRLDASHIILATGSREWVPDGIEVDGRRVLTSREALELRSVPRRLVVIGAGAVGVEFAYVYAMYGAKVTVLEMADQMLPGADAEVARVLARELERKSIDVRLATRFEGVENTGDGVRVHVDAAGERCVLEAEQLLVAVGRRPLSDDLGLEAVGVERDERGFVRVDAAQRTTLATVSAIGDVAGGALLAHAAMEEGIAAVELLAGIERPPPDPLRIPACIYAQPQVAWIGWTEAEAREQLGDAVSVGRFPFSASGKALAANHGEGFAKLVIDSRIGEIVGAHVIGHGATELIAELSLAMQLEATPAEIAHTVHAHPTLSEAVWEAALSAEGRSLNC